MCSVSVDLDIAPSTSFEQGSNKWKSNEAVASILLGAQENTAWVRSEVVPLACSGALYLYERKDGGYYKQDGYLWKRRRDGKLAREDHMKLKVRSVALISANYVHSALVPSFHRRAYWLLQRPDIILVHYLNVLDGGLALDGCNDTRPLRDRILSNVRHHGTYLKRSHLIHQLRSICLLHHVIRDLFQTTIVELVNEALPQPNERLLMAQPTLIVNNTTFPVTLTESEHNLIGRSSSCSVTARRRQATALGHSLDQQHLITDTVNGCMRVGMGSAQNIRAVSLATSTSSSSIGQHPNTVYDVPNQQAAVNDQQLFSVDTGIISPITDYSPDSANVQGGVKLLVTGAWSSSTSRYECCFDGLRVQAVLVQSGVLKCYCPPHSAGECGLCVLCEGQVVSNTVPFTYVDRPQPNTQPQLANTNHNHTQMQSTILERLEYLSQFLVTGTGLACDNNHEHHHDQHSDKTCAGVEHQVLLVCVRMQQMQWHKTAHDVVLEHSAPSKPLCLLHAVAALNWHHLLTTLLYWSSHNGSAVLWRELDCSERDMLGRTPLFVACAHAAEQCVRLLTIFSPQSCLISGPDSALPRDVLDANPHCSEHFKLWFHMITAKAQSRHAASSEVNATAVWVMSNGETITDRGCANSDQASQLTDCTTETQTTLHCAHCLLRTQSIYNTKHALDAQGVSYGCGAEGYSVAEDGVSDCDMDDCGLSSCAHTLHVQVPDSPELHVMWEQMTSPGAMASEDTRAQLACLAQQIIDSMPERIKTTNLPDTPAAPTALPSQSNPFLSSTMRDEQEDIEDTDQSWQKSTFDSYFSSTVLPTDSANYRSVSARSSPDVHVVDNLFVNVDTDTDNMVERTMSPMNDTERDSAAPNRPDSTSTRTSPLIDDFHELNLTDREQRELYEAARVIQTAYRQYKTRSSARQTQMEVNAAVTIQSYYRRYRQYIYFKRLHNAALLIQKHFRMYRAAKERCGAEGVASEAHGLSDHAHHGHAHVVGSMPMSGDCCARVLYEQSDCDCANACSCHTQHNAAKRIQHAYRGHYMRKRHAAARKIQRFMRESRKKVRTCCVSNELESCRAAAPPSSVLTPCTALTGATPTLTMTGGRNTLLHLDANAREVAAAAAGFWTSSPCQPTHVADVYFLPHAPSSSTAPSETPASPCPFTRNSPDPHTDTSALVSFTPPILGLDLDLDGLSFVVSK